MKVLPKSHLREMKVLSFQCEFATTVPDFPEERSAFISVLFGHLP